MISNKLASSFQLALPILKPSSNLYKYHQHNQNLASIGSRITFADILQSIRGDSKGNETSNISNNTTTLIVSSSSSATIAIPLTLSEIFTNLSFITTNIDKGNIYPLLLWINQHSNQLETIFSSIKIPESLLTSNITALYPISNSCTLQDLIITLHIIHTKQLLLGRLYLSDNEYTDVHNTNTGDTISSTSTTKDTNIMDMKENLLSKNPNVIHISDPSIAVSMAITYIQEHLLPLLDVSSPSDDRILYFIKKLMGSIVYAANDNPVDTNKIPAAPITIKENSNVSYNTILYDRLQRSPYASFYSSSALNNEELISIIHYYYCYYYGIASISPLEKIIQLSLMTNNLLSSLLKYAKLCSDTGGKYPHMGTLLTNTLSSESTTNIPNTLSTSNVAVTTNFSIELPIENIPLYHSIFACPVTRRACSDNNPPMLLPCGHVISQLSMDSLLSTRNTNILNRTVRFKCPTCPSLQTVSQTTKLILE